jgi:REP element-mobilizing transposase RayT
MSELRKANTDLPYFITFTVAGWIDIFTRQRYCDIIVQSLQYCIRFKNLEVYGFVIMPSHVHLIARSTSNKMASTIRDLKSFTAKEILKSIEQEGGESRKEWLLHMFEYFARFKQQNARHMFWDKTNHPVELSSPELFDQTMDYIHNNPVEAGYVLQPEMWTYSSACTFCPLKVSDF